MPYKRLLYLLFIIAILVILYIGSMFILPASDQLDIGATYSNREEGITTITNLSGYDGIMLSFDTYEFTLARADTPALRQLGLSGRVSVDPFDGMIFIFEREDVFGFWMKDMFFDLDIIWLDTDGRIVHIYENITPETYPTVFRPSTPALYVLEFPAGWVSEYSARVGDIFDIVE